MKSWYLYILQLEQGKYYVGITSKTPEIRFLQHKRGYMAANWTREYKPIKILDSRDLGYCDKEKAELYEARVTREYMEKYGDNNVRGGDLTETENYHRFFGRLFAKSDWSAVTLVMFLLFVIVVALFKR